MASSARPAVVASRRRCCLRWKPAAHTSNSFSCTNRSLIHLAPARSLSVSPAVQPARACAGWPWCVGLGFCADDGWRAARRVRRKGTMAGWPPAYAGRPATDDGTPRRGDRPSPSSPPVGCCHAPATPRRCSTNLSPPSFAFFFSFVRPPLFFSQIVGFLLSFRCWFLFPFLLSFGSASSGCYRCLTLSFFNLL